MKQIIVIRKDLKLSVGKIVAQAVHAAQRNTSPRYTLYKEEPTCIVCYVKSEQQLLNLYEKCSGIVPAVIQRDGGKNEVEKGTPTALNIGPYANHEVLDELTKKLQTVKAEVIWGVKCDMPIDDMSNEAMKVLIFRLQRRLKKETFEDQFVNNPDMCNHYYAEVDGVNACTKCNNPQPITK
jgi:peptidyl-tRNA hydrolase, PTH2 family